MSTAPHTPRAGNLVAAITALACCNVALGLIVPLVPLVMEAEGDSANGPPIAGQIIDHTNINTLPYMMAACCVVVLAGVFFAGGKVVPAAIAA